MQSSSKWATLMQLCNVFDVDRIKKNTETKKTRECVRARVCVRVLVCSLWRGLWVGGRRPTWWSAMDVQNGLVE